MHSQKAVTILILIALTAFPTIALAHQVQKSEADKPTARAEVAPATATIASNTSQKRKTRSSKQLRPIDADLPSSPISVVSAPAEYLSGEARVQVKGNENPIIRLGLAQSRVTLVEFLLPIDSSLFIRATQRWSR